jgi:hypothetical protein
MNIKNQVIDLLIAKKLKKIGIEQDSLWYWVKRYDVVNDKLKWGLFLKDTGDVVNEHISAFTASELSQMLPACHSDIGGKYELTLRYDYGKWYGCYEKDGNRGNFQLSNETVEDEYLTNCLAKLLIFIKKYEK